MEQGSAAHFRRSRADGDMPLMIVIDGSAGEGGGQMVRSALSLSLITGKPFRIRNIRAGREKPGLLHQHLTAVRAAASVSGGDSKGAELGSRHLEFHPGTVPAGDYEFSVGTAGSAALVCQTVLPALLASRGRSSLRVEGGTHNTQAPPFEFFDRSYIAVLRAMGAKLQAHLIRYGFYPRGGGVLETTIEGGSPLQRLMLLQRGEIVGRSAKVLISRLPRHIADRELRQFERDSGWSAGELVVEEITDAASPGNAIIAEVAMAHHSAVFAGFGEKGVPAEVVAAHCALQLRRWHESGAAVDEHLADQLLLPCLLAGGGEFTAERLSRHFMTNLEVLKAFADVHVTIEEQQNGAARVAFSAADLRRPPSC